MHSGGYPDDIAILDLLCYIPLSTIGKHPDGDEQQDLTAPVSSYSETFSEFSTGKSARSRRFF